MDKQKTAKRDRESNTETASTSEIDQLAAEAAKNFCDHYGGNRYRPQLEQAFKAAIEKATEAKDDNIKALAATCQELQVALRNVESRAHASERWTYEKGHPDDIWIICIGGFPKWSVQGEAVAKGICEAANQRQPARASDCDQGFGCPVCAATQNPKPAHASEQKAREWTVAVVKRSSKIGEREEIQSDQPFMSDHECIVVREVVPAQASEHGLGQWSPSVNPDKRKSQPAHASEPLDAWPLLYEATKMLANYEAYDLEQRQDFYARVNLTESGKHRAAHASEPYVPQSAFEKVADEMWSDEAAHWNEKSFKDKVIGILRQRSQSAHASAPPPAVRLALRVILNHIDDPPAWKNCKSTLELWLKQFENA